MQADASGSRWLQDIERRREANVEKLSGNSEGLVEKLVNYLPGTPVDIWLYEKGIAIPLLCMFMV